MDLKAKFSEILFEKLPLEQFSACDMTKKEREKDLVGCDRV